MIFYSPYSLNIYTDGSAKPTNPGPGGIAGVIEYPEKNNKMPKKLFQEGYIESTSQRMELRACIKAMGYIKENVRIGWAFVVTDSRYVYEGRDSVFYRRHAKWINKEGMIYENIDLWKKFISLKSAIKINFDVAWQEGKKTELTKWVDDLARKATEFPNRKKDVGYIPPKISRKKSNIKYAAQPIYSPENKFHLVRIFEHEPCINGKRVEYKITFELIEENIIVDKLFTYLKEEDKKLIHRQHFYRIRCTQSKSHPVIIEFEEMEKREII